MIKRSESFGFVGSSFSSFLILLSSSVLLGLELFSIDLFSLLLENSLDQNGLVLELVTLGSKIKSVIQSSIDLL